MRRMDGDCVDYSKSITLLAQDCKHLKLVLDEMKQKRRDTDNLISKINGARVKCKRAVKWQNHDPLDLGQWLILLNKCNKILNKVDATKVLPEVLIDKDQRCNDVSDISTSTNMLPINENTQVK